GADSVGPASGAAPTLADLPSDLVRQVEAACAAFQTEWAAGRRPALEDFLSRVEPPARAALLGELLGIEVACRRRAGQPPQVAEYRGRFPHEPGRVAAVFVEALCEGLRDDGSGAVPAAPAGPSPQRVVRDPVATPGAATLPATVLPAGEGRPRP